MSTYKSFHFTRDGFDEPIACKINAQNFFVRIAEPFHEIIHLHHPLFKKSSQVVVTNAYGAQLFQLQTVPNQKEQWLIAQRGQASLKLSFSHNGHPHATLEDAKHVIHQFTLLETEELSLLEKEMLGAALVACHLQKQLHSNSPAIKTTSA